MVVHEVTRNREQPRTDRRISVVHDARPLPRSEQDLLDDVLGQLRVVGGQPADITVQRYREVAYHLGHGSVVHPHARRVLHTSDVKHRGPNWKHSSDKGFAPQTHGPETGRPTVAQPTTNGMGVFKTHKPGGLWVLKTPFYGRELRNGSWAFWKAKLKKRSQLMDHVIRPRMPGETP